MLKTVVAASAVVLLLTASALAQQPAAPAPAAPAAPSAPAAATPPPALGMNISAEKAKKALAAAEAEAQKNNWNVAIAVVDTGGNLMAFSKADNVQVGSIGIARGKAETSAHYRRPTKFFEDQIAGGGAGLRWLSVPGVNALEGGVPIVSDGKLIGAIGVSGVTSQQDAQIGRAGADAAK